MAEVRAAGVHSGAGASTSTLEGNLPFAGIIGDTLRRPPRSVSSSCGPRFITTGDRAPCEALRRSRPSSQLCGHVPRPDVSRQRACIPGYSGHIQGKLAENLHGATFGVENERASTALPLRELRRTFSEPSQLEALRDTGRASQALEVAPHVPGYGGAIPGKDAEGVHGLTFAEASEAAQKLRDFNPCISAEGWLRRGRWPVDRLATYKWSNRFCRADLQPLFSDWQESEARESNKRLGHTFGLHPPLPSPYKPGDRFLHYKWKGQEGSRRDIDPITMAPAGQPSASVFMDQLRWAQHSAVGGGHGGGNMRPAY